MSASCSARSTDGHLWQAPVLVAPPGLRGRRAATGGSAAAFRRGCTTGYCLASLREAPGVRALRGANVQTPGPAIGRDGATGQVRKIFGTPETLNWRYGQVAVPGQVCKSSEPRSGVRRQAHGTAGPDRFAKLRNPGAVYDDKHTVQLDRTGSQNFGTPERYTTTSTRYSWTGQVRKIFGTPETLNWRYGQVAVPGQVRNIFGTPEGWSLTSPPGAIIAFHPISFLPAHPFPRLRPPRRDVAEAGEMQSRGVGEGMFATRRDDSTSAITISKRDRCRLEAERRHFGTGKGALRPKLQAITLRVMPSRTGPRSGKGSRINQPRPTIRRRGRGWRRLRGRPASGRSPPAGPRPPARPPG